MIEIPPDRLNRDTLHALTEAFVLREGTDYGDHEFELSTKVEQVMGQIARGDVVILFDPETETCNLLTRREYREVLANRQAADGD